MRRDAPANPLPWLLLVTALSTFLIQSGELGTSDTAHRLQVAHSLWTGEPQVLPDEYPEFGIHGRGGRLYAWYGIGQSLLMLPADLVATPLSRVPLWRKYTLKGTDPTVRAIVVSISTNILVSVLTALAAFRLLGLLGFSVRESVAGTLALLFATTHLHYAQNMTENNYILLLTLAGFALQYRWLITGSWRALVCGSVALGLNLLTRLTTALDILAVALFLLLAACFQRRFKRVMSVSSGTQEGVEEVVREQEGRPQRLKPDCKGNTYGTDKSVPLSKAGSSAASKASIDFAAVTPGLRSRPFKAKTYLGAAHGANQRDLGTKARPIKTISATYLRFAVPIYAVFLFLDRLYQYIRFGSWTNTYMTIFAHEQRHLNPSLPANFPFNGHWLRGGVDSGLLGPFLSPAKSILIFDPLFPLTLLLTALLWKRLAAAHRAFALATFALLGAYVTFYGHYLWWAGDSAWGDRYISTAVELTTLVAIPFLLRYKAVLGRPIWILGLATTAASVAIQLASLAFWLPLEIYQMDTFGSHTWVVPLRFKNIAAFTLGQQHAWGLLTPTMSQDPWDYAHMTTWNFLPSLLRHIGVAPLWMVHLLYLLWAAVAIALVFSSIKLVRSLANLDASL